MSKSFFVVWNIQHGLPRYQHNTHLEAIAEAKRLARCNPGEEFHVLACTGMAVKDDVKFEPVENVPQLFNEFDDEIPF